MFSQNDEEKYILEFFKNKKGRVLDIGAFHPEIFSNSRQLILNGWEGVLVEGSPECYNTIVKFYKDNKNVTVVNTILSDYDGYIVFYNSEGAVGTTVKEHYTKWKNYQKDYKKIILPCMSWNTFYKIYPGKYEFISIDTEGNDYTILKQMDLKVMETELICIEITYNFIDILNYLQNNGFTKLITKTNENIIIGR